MTFYVCRFADAVTSALGLQRTRANLLTTPFLCPRQPTGLERIKWRARNAQGGCGAFRSWWLAAHCGNIGATRKQAPERLKHVTLVLCEQCLAGFVLCRSGSG